MDAQAPKSGVSKKVSVIMAGITAIGASGDQIQTQIIIAIVVLGFVITQAILDKKEQSENSDHSA